MAVLNKPDDAVSELTEFRTLNSKRFDLGNGFQRIIHSIGRVHFQDDDGSLKDLDTTLGIDSVTGEMIASQLPFKFRLLKNGIGYIYQSRNGGTVRVELRRIGATAIDTNALFTATRAGNLITFADVVTGTDIVIKVNQNGIQVFRKLKTAAAAKTWRWGVTYDAAGLPKIGAAMQGNDATKRELAGLSMVNGASVNNGNGTFSYVSNESWDGSVITVDPKTRIKTQTQEPQFPVLIDPDVTETIPSNDNDGYAAYHVGFSGNWNGNIIKCGRLGGFTSQFGAGLRFTTVAVANAASISLANLKVYITGKEFGYPYAYVQVYGYKIGNSLVWNSPYSPPYYGYVATAPRTTAKTKFTPTTSGLLTLDVTAQVQEIVNLAGWATGNNMSFMILPADSVDFRVNDIEDYHAAAGHAAVLEITLSGGGGGATPTPQNFGIINNPVNF